MKKMNLFLMVSFFLGSVNACAMYADYQLNDEIQAKYPAAVEKAEVQRDKLEDRAVKNKTKRLERVVILQAQLEKKVKEDSKK